MPKFCDDHTKCTFVDTKHFPACLENPCIRWRAFQSLAVPLYPFDILSLGHVSVCSKQLPLCAPHWVTVLSQCGISCAFTHFPILVLFSLYFQLNHHRIRIFCLIGVHTSDFNPYNPENSHPLFSVELVTKSSLQRGVEHNTWNGMNWSFRWY